MKEVDTVRLRTESLKSNLQSLQAQAAKLKTLVDNLVETGGEASVNEAATRTVYKTDNSEIEVFDSQVRGSDDSKDKNYRRERIPQSITPIIAGTRDHAPRRDGGNR